LKTVSTLRNLPFCFPKAKPARVLNKRKKKIMEMLETFPYDKKQKKIFFKSFKAKKMLRSLPFRFPWRKGRKGEGRKEKSEKKFRKA
jgi:hypothetical protein